jgi:hypothetical protein
MNRSGAAVTERRIDPDMVDDIAQLLDQQATRERSMAAAFLAAGRGGLARQHERRASAAMFGRPVLKWAMVLGLQGLNAVTGLADLVDEVRQEREVQSAERDVVTPAPVTEHH